MFPYNEKLWRIPLSEMSMEWQGRFVPKPSASEVLYGSFMDQKKVFGYNATFRYPLRGGIQVLPDALKEQLPPGQVRTGSPVLSVDLKNRTAQVFGLGEVSFGRLVNTLPLTDFLDLAQPLPARVREARGRLRYNSVYCLNLGIAREDLSPRHWAYFPEKKYPFYRVGFSSHFSKTNTPPGATSLYIEVSGSPEEKVDLEVLENQILKGLRDCRILKATDRFLAKLWIPIRCAYVVYDFKRPAALAEIFAHLGRIGVETIGRYGAWKYSFMEEAILDGKACAERLALGRARSLA
jgi:UDP-galactopyranose mutase